MVIVPIVTALGGVVLSELRGAGMASDRTEVTVIPSVLARSKWHAYPCQNGRSWLRSTSPRSSQGSGRRRGRESLARRTAKGEGGVAANPSLGVKHVLLGLAGPRLFGPSLTDILRAAWPAE